MFKETVIGKKLLTWRTTDNEQGVEQRSACLNFFLFQRLYYTVQFE